MLHLWAFGRFLGAVLENCRDSPGRTEIKPKEKYKWKKKGGWQAGLERSKPRWERRRERERKEDVSKGRCRKSRQ